METTYAVFLHINKPLHSATLAVGWIGLLKRYNRLIIS